jgi:hypothetical protein
MTVRLRDNTIRLNLHLLPHKLSQNATVSYDTAYLKEYCIASLAEISSLSCSIIRPQIVWRHVELLSCLAILLPQDFPRFPPSFPGVCSKYNITFTTFDILCGLETVHSPSRWGAYLSLLFIPTSKS